MFRDGYVDFVKFFSLVKVFDIYSELLSNFISKDLKKFPQIHILKKMYFKIQPRLISEKIKLKIKAIKSKIIGVLITFFDANGFDFQN